MFEENSNKLKIEKRTFISFLEHLKMLIPLKVVRV